MKAISENTTIAMVVNGFMFRSFLERLLILDIYRHLYATVNHPPAIRICRSRAQIHRGYDILRAFCLFAF